MVITAGCSLWIQKNRLERFETICTFQRDNRAGINQKQSFFWIASKIRHWLRSLLCRDFPFSMSLGTEGKRIVILIAEELICWSNHQPLLSTVFHVIIQSFAHEKRRES
jgi:hypothetical protein